MLCTPCLAGLPRATGACDWAWHVAAAARVKGGDARLTGVPAPVPDK